MITIDFSGKVVAVTGGGGSIGGGICERMAACGANVAVIDYSRELADSVVAKLEKEYGVKAKAYLADVSDEALVNQVFAEVIKDFGKIDFMVAAAGIGGSITGEKFTVDTPTEIARKVIDVNLYGTIYAVRAVLPHMEENGFGRIVTISSIAGRGAAGNGKLPYYSIAKSGIISLTQSVARTYAKKGITINSVLPGYIWSQMYDYASKHFSKEWNCTPEEAWQRMALNNIPQGEAQTPEDMGNAVAFFCSYFGDHITGQSLNVDGGVKMN